MNFRGCAQSHLVLGNWSPANLPSTPSITSSPPTCYSCLVMSQKQNFHASLLHGISFDQTVSSPTPSQEGRSRGYFDDHLTCDLLGLAREDILLHSGTYGKKDLGQLPVDIRLATKESLDQWLLPFVPKSYAYYFQNLAFHNKTGHWMVSTESAKFLNEVLGHTMMNAQEAGKLASLSLPAYAHILVPQLLKNPKDQHPFSYQFQKKFSPSAICARWVWIARVIGLLHGYINLCHQLVGDQSSWYMGEPVGLLSTCPLFHLNESDRTIVQAYQFLGLSLAGGPHAHSDLTRYMPTDARCVLLGFHDGKVEVLLIFKSERNLEGHRDDSLSSEYNEGDGTPVEQPEAEELPCSAEGLTTNAEGSAQGGTQAIAPHGLLEVQDTKDWNPAPTSTSDFTPSVSMLPSASSSGLTPAPTPPARWECAVNWQGSCRRPRAHRRCKHDIYVPPPSPRALQASSTSPHNSHCHVSMSPDIHSSVILCQSETALVPYACQSTPSCTPYFKPLAMCRLPVQRCQGLFCNTDTGDMGQIPYIEFSFSEIRLTQYVSQGDRNLSPVGLCNQYQGQQGCPWPDYEPRSLPSHATRTGTGMRMREQRRG